MALVDAFGGAFGAAFGPAFGWSAQGPNAPAKPTHRGRAWVGDLWQEQTDPAQGSFASLDDALDYLNRKPKMTKRTRAKLRRKAAAAQHAADQAAAQIPTARAGADPSGDLPPLPDLQAPKIDLASLRAWFTALRAKLAALEAHRRTEEQAAVFLALIDD